MGRWVWSIGRFYYHLAINGNMGSDERHSVLGDNYCYEMRPTAPTEIEETMITQGTCPHCGRTTNTAALGRHARLCLENPENRARVVELLTAHDDVGVTYSEYLELVKSHHAPAATTLRRYTGRTSWTGVLAAFGLRREKEERLVTCPTCGRTVKAQGLANHERKCGNGRAAAVAAEVEEEQAILRYERRILAEDTLRAQCLPVGRITDLGNGFVRCEIR